MAVSSRKIICFCSVFTAAGLFYMFSICFGPAAANENAECFSRCEKLTGSARRLCIEGCAKSVTSEPRERNLNRQSALREKTEFCDGFCKSYEGLEQVKCRRICLDKYDEFEKAVEKAVKENGDTAEKSNAVEESINSKCEKRCATLNEPYKSECVLKCKRSSR